MKKLCLLISLCALAVGAAYADSGITLNFPSATTYYCAGGNCGFIGNNGGVSGEMSDTTDYITETFNTGQSYVDDLTGNFSVFNNFGGAPGTPYWNYVYVNNVLVAYFALYDCDFCNTLQLISGTVNFAPIDGNGTYTITIAPYQTTPSGNGWEQFSALNADGSPSTMLLSSPSVPEPSGWMMLGPAMLTLAGLRRKLMR